MTLEELIVLTSHCEATSDHSVTVYDRPRTDDGAQIIGTVNAGPRGVEAHRPHYSLAERYAARIDGEFATIGDGVAALLKDYEMGQTA